MAMLARVRSLVVLVVVCVIFSSAAAWQASQPGSPAERLEPLRGDGTRYWKGNLHTHSFWSDGDDFPEMIADWYQRHGYHFLAMTDHNVLSDGERWLDIDLSKPARKEALEKYVARFGPTWVETRAQKDKTQVRLKPLAEFRSMLEVPGHFLMIPGEEITHRFAKLPVHINAINVRDLVTPADGGSVRETIQVNHRLVAEQQRKTRWRTIAVLNHPNFGWGVRAEDMIEAEELRYFEVFNGHPSVRNYGDQSHAASERMWDIILALRLGKHRLPVVYGLATDDAHGYHVYGVGKVNPGRGWIMVKAPYLAAEALVNAMATGNFYASTGVTLTKIHCDDKTVALSIRPEKGVSYRTQFLATMKDAPLSSEPHRDAKGEPLQVTEIYSPEIGKVVAETTSLEPAYQWTGQELYVRAKVISSKTHPNPYQQGDLEMAWTQPVLTR
jgi:predicted metal-dependent phosphoesterase TrpH